MDIPQITSAGVYTFAQKTFQQINHFWISFNISGLLHQRIFYPDGKLCSEFDSDSEIHRNIPFLTLGYPGFSTEFEYGPDRENWVIIMKCDAIKFNQTEHQLYLDYNGTCLPVPRTIAVNSAEVSPLRHTFRTIREYFYSAIPRNILIAEIMVQNLLLRFLEPLQSDDDPVEQLRKKIDADEKWEKNIAEHCRDIGFGRDWLRREFMKRYKVAPGEYRIRKRLQRVLYLFSYSNLTLKEIAFETGMRNATHLNSMLKQFYGKTPSELCREYRENRSGVFSGEPERDTGLGDFGLPKC